MKDLQRILDEGSTDGIEGLENLLQEIFNSGVLTPGAVEQAMVFQKAISSSGVGAETVARAVLLQKSMAESGMALHEIANAMSLIMTMEKEEKVKELKEALKGCIGRGLTPDDVELLIAFKDEIEKGDIPKEAIAKAMVKALQATGATPQEIAKTMQPAMSKSGASQEEICKAMAAAMAASGASAEEIAIA